MSDSVGLELCELVEMRCHDIHKVCIANRIVLIETVGGTDKEDKQGVLALLSSLAFGNFRFTGTSIARYFFSTVTLLTVHADSPDHSDPATSSPLSCPT